MIVVVTGTGTDIGKTWFTAATIEALRRRSPVAAESRESFALGDEGSTDADLLARASDEDPRTVCPPHRWLPAAVAPPMAAVALGLEPFTIADLASEVRSGGADDAPVITFVEGAGGRARRLPTTATRLRSRTRSRPIGS